MKREGLLESFQKLLLVIPLSSQSYALSSVLPTYTFFLEFYIPGSNKYSLPDCKFTILSLSNFILKLMLFLI